MKRFNINPGEITFDLELLAEHTVNEDHKIGEDALLLDDFLLHRILNLKFISPGNGFLEIVKGGGRITINGKEYEVTDKCSIIFIKGQSCRTRFTEDTVLRGALFTERFTEKLYLEGLKFNDLRATFLESPVIHMSNDLLDEMDLYVKQLHLIAARADNRNNIECAVFLTLALFYGSMYSSFKIMAETTTFRGPKLASRFFSLLETHFKERHTLDFYADHLSISKRYLYDTVIAMTGRSPSYWVDYYMTSEAKRLIMDRETSFQQISQQLGFSGLPSFCKFFRKQTNMSPGEYRKSISGLIPSI